MKIAIIAPFEEPIPPKKYGGIERVVSYLTEELVRGGHDVTLYATGDVETRSKLVKIFPKAIRSFPEMGDTVVRSTYVYEGIGRLIPLVNMYDYDIIHNHIGWNLLAFETLFKSPIITTIHGPLSAPSQRVMYGLHPKSRLVSISNSQRRSMPDLNYIANVYNGIDPEDFSFNDKPDDYLVFLGRISPEKGPVQAIEIAKKAQKRLIIAAKIDPIDRDYFEKQINPLIDGRQISFIGEVDQAEKSRLLSQAQALLAPIQWEEPFGLYFIEALACGTPVVVFDRGSAREIIENSKTGFICRDIDEAAIKLRKIGKIDRNYCRAYVEKNFSVEMMANNYLAAYVKVLSKR